MPLLSLLPMTLGLLVMTPNPSAKRVALGSGGVALSSGGGAATRASETERSSAAFSDEASGSLGGSCSSAAGAVGTSEDESSATRPNSGARASAGDRAERRNALRSMLAPRLCFLSNSIRSKPHGLVPR